eukprot:TRINITY_DN1092_c0_g1_i6.p1 TRINITY_DN1092_c0_g1~~TRINITY_DN1092_c0_g1_i6.p1  ORF type:complete len:180 (+),score=36.79 TRINITY_DN1092_c0_g1_i6:917-1456(+)
MQEDLTSDATTTLQFPPETLFPGPRLRKDQIVVQDCYRQLYATMKSHMNEYKDGGGVFIVTGEQGTGKTSFLYYVMWRLAQEGVTTVVYDAKDREHPVLFPADAAREGPSNAPVFRAAFRNPATWHLVDDKPPAMEGFSHDRVVLVASSKSVWKEIFKRDDADIAFMPPLSDEPSAHTH